MPPGHPLAAKCSIGVEDLDGVPLITMTRRYPSRHRIEQLFRRAGIPMRLRAETNLSGTICDLVRLGHGGAILTGLSWAGGSQHAPPVRPRKPPLAHPHTDSGRAG